MGELKCDCGRADCPHCVRRWTPNITIGRHQREALAYTRRIDELEAENERLRADLNAASEGFIEVTRQRDAAHAENERQRARPWLRELDDESAAMSDKESTLAKLEDENKRLRAAAEEARQFIGKAAPGTSIGYILRKLDSALEGDGHG